MAACLSIHSLERGLSKRSKGKKKLVKWVLRCVVKSNMRGRPTIVKSLRCGGISGSSKWLLVTSHSTITSFVRQCEMFFVSPSVRDISREPWSHMSHCQSVWSQQPGPCLRTHARTHMQTHAHTHAHTEALSVAAVLVTHWDTLSTFIALSQWATVWRKTRPSHPPIINHRPGLLCAARRGGRLHCPLCATLLYIKVSCNTKHIAVAENRPWKCASL